MTLKFLCILDIDSSLGEIKAELIKVLTEMIKTHQEARAKVTEEVVDQFMTPRALDLSR